MTKHDNLWAPWRMNYILGLDSEAKPEKKDNSETVEVEKECFICHNLANPQDDDENLVLWRTEHSIVILNRYPYNNGHLLIAPKEHVAGLEQSSDEQLLDMMKLIREAIRPQGFNVGMNFSRCAGAGLPGHMHIHVVPRWNGDTNFMSVCSETKVISQSLIELLELLKKVSGENKLPCL